MDFRPRLSSCVVAVVLGLSLGCGGMDSGSDSEEPAWVGDETPQETESSLGANCGKKLAAAGLSVSGEDAPTPGKNAVDSNLTTRWSAKGIGQYITIDLGQAQDVCGVGVGWYNGVNGRVNHFVVSVSTDNATFKPVFAGDSSGKTTALELTALSSTVKARYVRVTVNGNTVNTWASITELSLLGPSDTTPPQTTLGSAGPAHGHVETSTSASFTFSADEVGARFECRLNGADWVACSSPHALSNLALRVHTLEVRAVDTAGNTDATPEKRIWTVVSGVPGVVKPGPDNTGVPAGTVLQRYDGNIVVTEAGKHLDALDIHGSVQVKAANVKITRCIIRGGYSADTATATGTPLVYNYTPEASFVIEDSELVPEYPSIWVDGIRGLNFTARRVEISNTTDGIGINGVGNTNTVNARVESNWIHDMRHVQGTPPGYQSDNQTHNDGIQYHYGNNARIIGNLITGAHNAAMMISQTGQGTWDLEIRDNWLDGGACTVNMFHTPTKFTQMPPPGMNPGIAFTGNKFGNTTACAIYKTPATLVTLSGNIKEDTAAPVVVTVNNK